MGYGVAFSPLVPQIVLWAAVAVAVVIAALLIAARTRGALLRALALTLVVLALANPSLTREDREPLTSVAVVVIDKITHASRSATARTRPRPCVRHLLIACRAFRVLRGIVLFVLRFTTVAVAGSSTSRAQSFIITIRSLARQTIPPVFRQARR